MKKLLFALLMLLTLATPAEAKSDKVGICHITGNGSYRYLEVDDDGAYNGHIHHDGDLYNVNSCPSDSTPTNTPTNTPVVITDCKNEQGEYIPCPTSTTEASATPTSELTPTEELTVTPSPTATNSVVPSTTPLTTATTVDGTPVGTATSIVREDGLPSTGTGTMTLEAEVNRDFLIGLIAFLTITLPLALWLKRRYN